MALLVQFLRENRTWATMTWNSVLVCLYTDTGLPGSLMVSISTKGHNSQVIYIRIAILPQCINYGAKDSGFRVPSTRLNFLCHMVTVAGCDHFQNCVLLCLSFQNLIKFYKSVNWNLFFWFNNVLQIHCTFLKLIVLTWVCYLFLLYCLMI